MANSETQQQGCELSEAGCMGGNAMKRPALPLLELLRHCLPCLFYS